MAGFKQKWQSLSLQELRDFFLCDMQKGLSSQEASLRISRFGINNIEQFSDAIWNSLKTVVIRDGKKSKISNNLISLGDIVYLSKNKIVPSDIRLVNVDNLSVNQSILNGSELVVYKNSNTIRDSKVNKFDLKNMVYAGSLVVHGSAVGVVVATGSDTALSRMPKIAQKTPRKIKKIQKVLAKQEIIFNNQNLENTKSFVDTIIINFPASIDTIKEFIRVFSHQLGKNLIICTDEQTARRLISITPGMTHINRKYFKENSTKALMEADYPLMSFIDVDSSDILKFHKILTMKRRTAICLDSGVNSIIPSSNLMTIVPVSSALDEAIIKSDYLVKSFDDIKKLIDQTELIIG